MTNGAKSTVWMIGEFLAAYLRFFFSHLSSFVVDCNLNIFVMDCESDKTSNLRDFFQHFLSSCGPNGDAINRLIEKLILKTDAVI